MAKSIKDIILRNILTTFVVKVVIEQQPETRYLALAGWRVINRTIYAKDGLPL